MRDVRGDAGSESTAAAARARSYEDFVGTRGPGLYRLAHLLAGDRQEAEQLLQVALVRLCLGWRRAARAESPEEVARGLVVDTFVTAPAGLRARLDRPSLVQVPPEDLPEPDPAEGLHLWPLLAALPPRERAALVLRCHEQLSDARIGVAVRRPPRVAGSLAQDALDALATDPQADTGAAPRADPVDLLQRELQLVADTRVLPVVDTDGLVRLAAGERGRRRRQLARTTGAVAVVVVVAALLLHLTGGSRPAASRPARHPEALAQLPRGPQTTLPWWSGGELHEGSRVLPTNHAQVVSAAGTTLVGDAGVEDDHLAAAWWFVDGHDLVPLASSAQGVFRPVVSPQGDLVAWAEPLDATHRRLVLWSRATRRRVGTLRVRVHLTCCGPQGDVDLRGIDPEGRVLFRTSGTLWMWSPGGRVRRVRGIDASLYDVQVWPGGVTWRPWNDDRLGPFPVSFGIVDARGRLHPEGTVPELGLWAPDGSRYAWPTESGSRVDGSRLLDRVRVRQLLTGESVTMRLPERVSYQLVGWESPTDLVIAVRRDTTVSIRGSDLPAQVQLLRCHADTGACETAGLAPQTILELGPTS